MNINLYIFYMLILFTEAYNWRRNDCSPEQGEFCITIRQCPFFVLLLKNSPIPRPRSVIKIIRDKECGFENNHPKVCCTLSRNDLPPIKNVHQSKHITSHFNLRLLPSNDCGRIAMNFLITNGLKTAPSEFPWMALLSYHSENGIVFKCGGTVINNRYVLTAAHCISATLAGVRLGEHNINTDRDCDFFTGQCSTSPVQDYYVEQVVIHHNYKPEKSRENDIALIRLATPVKFSPDIQPICLPIGEAAEINLDKKFAIVAGWGQTETGYKSSVLLKVSVPVIPLEECKSINSNYEYLSNKQICAGGVMGRDACSGDSGGPLKYVSYQNGKSRYVQYGIVSYGPAYCGTPGLPGVYTNVTYYIAWILNSIMP